MCEALNPSTPLKREKLVTVVIPAYNAENTIKLTIESALTQSHTDVDIVVVDDASTDSTGELIAREFNSHPKVTIITCKVNAGVCRARNSGIRYARSDLILCLDADDILHPNAISVLLNSIIEQQNIVMAYGATVTMSEKGLLDRDSPLVLRPTDQKDFFQGFLARNLVGHGSGILFRKSLTQKFNFFDENMRKNGGEGCADWMFYLNASRVGRIVAVPALTICYRTGSNTMSSNGDSMISSHAQLIIKAQELKPDLNRVLLKGNTARFSSRFIVSFLLNGRFLRATGLFVNLLRSDPKYSIIYIKNNILALVKLARSTLHQATGKNTLIKAEIYMGLQREQIHRVINP